MRPTLAIAIPTYCRAQQLALNFDEFMREAADLGVEIYISDDSPDSSTEILASAAMQKYGNVTYRQNAPSLGHDLNVMQALLWPDAEYVWVMGDVFRTEPGGLKAVLDTLTGQDFQFINRNANDFHVTPPCSGEAGLQIIRAKIWHQTLTGGTIYHRRVREWVRTSKIATHNNFPHLDVILGYSAAHDISVGWFGRRVLKNEPKPTSYWHKNVFEVFVDDWVSAITAYPTVLPRSQIRQTLKSHSKNTRFFNSEFMLELRHIGYFDWASTRRDHFWDAMHLPRVILLGMLMLPKSTIPHVVRTKKVLESVLKRRRG